MHECDETVVLDTFPRSKVFFEEFEINRTIKNIAFNRKVSESSSVSECDRRRRVGARNPNNVAKTYGMKTTRVFFPFPYAVRFSTRKTPCTATVRRSNRPHTIIRHDLLYPARPVANTTNVSVVSKRVHRCGTPCESTDNTIFDRFFFFFYAFPLLGPLAHVSTQIPQ